MTRRLPAASTLRAAFIAASIIWMILLIVAPFVASRAHASTLGTLFVVSVYGVGSVVCHQLAERSYHLWTAQMPVCARCAGIYFGAAVSAICAAIYRTTEVVRHDGLSVSRHDGLSVSRHDGLSVSRHDGLSVSRHDGLSVAQGFSLATRARLALALAVTPTALTLIYEWTTGQMPAHAIRALAGVPIGAVAAWLVVTVADNQVN